MALTDRTIKQAKPKPENNPRDYKLFDEKGLYLLVKKNGSKYWRFKYRYFRKEKLLSIGVYPDVSLKKAREKRDEARSRLSDGIDPSAHKKAIKEARLAEMENTFEKIALEWFDKHILAMSESHQIRTRRLLNECLFPYVGRLPIVEVKTSMILNAMRKLEKLDKIETAHRTKQVAGQVFRYAVGTGRAERDPTIDIDRKALKKKTTKHLASITKPEEVAKLLIAIDSYQGGSSVSNALKLAPLIFLRPGELRRMEWKEMNWQKNQWEIPKAKMKMDEDHIVPLSKQALAIIAEQEAVSGNRQFVFPGIRSPRNCLSDNALRAALRTLGYSNEQMTPHGFRAMARTILDEELEYRVDWIEHQLAHAVKDTNGRAYNRTSHLKQRSEMMQKWADYLDALKAFIDSGKEIDLSKYRYKQPE